VPVGAKDRDRLGHPHGLPHNTAELRLKLLEIHFQEIQQLVLAEPVEVYVYLALQPRIELFL